MKSWASIGRIAAGILALVILGASSRADAAVGRTVGTYAVSGTGAATYTIPLWAPRGPNGLQPAMSLSYNSQSGDGYLGIGWSIAGLSSIYRCTQTYAQDPAPAPVTLTASDVFCMDGQRLRLTSGSYGVAGSTYQTEIANFANVTANGSAPNGPAYFEVQGRDGRTYEYGIGGSQVLAGSTPWIWYLDKVTDRAGNTMTVSYCPDSNNPNCPAAGALVASTVPSMISWTPSSYGSTTYTYEMVFAYTSNVPQSSIYGYVGGTAYSNASLLASISINYSGTTVKKYVLTYGQSPTTSREELTGVQECADAGATNCLAATQLTYQSGQIGVSTNATSAITATATNLKTHNDFNGDGLNDLAYCNGGSPNTIYVVMASSSGYGSPLNTGLACNAALYGDLTGSGKDGILVPNGTDWWYYTWNGSSFSGEDTGLAYDSTASQYVLADVNGDGLPDLISSYVTTFVTKGGKIVYTYYFYARMNATSGSSVSFSTNNGLWYGPISPSQAIMISNTDYPYGTNSYGTKRALDFNGDGRQDIALETMTPSGSSYVINTYELISTGSSFTATLITTGASASWGTTAFIDFNSDNCTDYAYNGVIYVSGCNGSVTQQISLGAGVNIIGAMDWDGDGRADILVQNGSTIGVYLSEGDGISSLQSTSIPYNSSNLYFAFDSNGDGLDDLGVYASSGTVSYYVHNGVAQPPDLLSSVTDGYGNFAKPTYVSMALSAYFNTWQDATYPYWNYIGPIYIVNQTTFSDPSNQPNGTYQQSDYYAGAWMDLWGRGFAGFGSHQMYDSRNGVWETWGYNRAFPYTGTLNADIATQNNSSAETIFYRKYTAADTVLDGTQNNDRHFVYVSSSSESDYEVGGTENGDLITTKSASYSYDDWGNLTSATQTTTDNDPGSPYVGDSWTRTVTNIPDVNPSTWCLGLSSELQVDYSASNGSPSVTRTKEFTPDTTACLYKEIETEPSSSTYKVTEAIGYDTFGNINSDTITGTGMAARLTSANWGATGQFPMSVTDASGASTQLNYNFSYGLVSSKTDPNGLVTSWAYGDGFGRVTQETRPDGTYTTWQYNSCANANGCLLGSNTMAVSHNVYSSSGSLENDGTTTYDQVDRPYVSNDMLLAGNFNRIDTRYDSLGRVVESSMPCSWSSMPNVCPYNTTYAYDGLNRVTQLERPINQSDSTLQTTSYGYAGRTTTIADPYGHTRTLIRDVNGWLRQTKDPLGYSIILGYDAAGGKTSVTDSLGNSLWTGTYAYGTGAFLVGESDVDRGTWGYTVDALGERTAWTDPKGQHFYESYDAVSRPLARTEPDLFTQWTWGTSVASHNIGQLQSVCMGTGSACSSSYNSENDTYDSLGRLYQKIIDYPAYGTFTFTWQYNATTGLLDTLTYPQSPGGKQLKLKYAYQNDVLQSITDILDSPNVTIWQANAVNPAGQITQETLGNGLVKTRAYDAVTQWLASVQSGPGGGASIQNQSFLYDEVGDVTQRQDNNAGLTENFYYDNDSRLSYSSLNGNQNLSLTYGPMGNITSRSDVASGATWTYDPTHLHRVTEAGSTAYQYVYDVNGNMTSRQGNPITWSSYNYPATFTDSATGESVAFKYNSDRRAWYEQTNGPAGLEQIYRFGGLYDLVVSGGVNDGRHYIYAGSEPVAIISRKSTGVNTIYYLLSDHQGSIAAITNSLGSIVVGESFTAYGSRRNPSTWSGAPSAADLSTITGITRHGYTFQDALGQMGLNDMVGRVQDAITGRFLSADPTIPDPTDAQSYNRYSYVYNNPLTYTDPSGFCGFTAGGAGGTEPFSATVCGGPDDGADFGGGGQGSPGGPGSPLANPGLETYRPPQKGSGEYLNNHPNPTPSKPAAPQQSNPSQSGCAYIACPVVQASREPPLPFELPPAITPGTFAIDSYANALDQALANIDSQILAKLVMMGHLAHAGEQYEPKPPEPETPSSQTTEQPYNPSEWFKDPMTGAVYNPTTGEAFNPITGRPMPMPEDIFIDF